MAARFVDVSVTDIDQFKENAVPQKTKEARLIKFFVFQVTQLTENWHVCLHFFASKCRQL